MCTSISGIKKILVVKNNIIVNWYFAENLIQGFFSYEFIRQYSDEKKY